jgi:hypothetical protein
MATKTVTDHRDEDGKHTREIHTERNDGSQRIVVQEVKDTPLGELGASNIRVTEIDSKGNSRTTRS